MLAPRLPMPTRTGSDAPTLPAVPVQVGVAVEAQRIVGNGAVVAHRGVVPRWVALGRGRGGLAMAVAGLVGFGAIFAVVRARRS